MPTMSAFIAQSLSWSLSVADMSFIEKQWYIYRLIQTEEGTNEIMRGLAAYFRSAPIDNSTKQKHNEIIRKIKKNRNHQNITNDVDENNEKEDDGDIEPLQSLQSMPTTSIAYIGTFLSFQDLVSFQSTARYISYSINTILQITELNHSAMSRLINYILYTNDYKKISILDNTRDFGINLSNAPKQKKMYNQIKHTIYNRLISHSKSLHIQCEMTRHHNNDNNDENDENKQNVIELLQNGVNLHSLSLLIDTNYLFLSDFEDEIVDKINNMKELQKLYLDFNGDRWFHEHVIYDIDPIISNLKTIGIRYNYAAITNLNSTVTGKSINSTPGIVVDLKFSEEDIRKLHIEYDAKTEQATAINEHFVQLSNCKMVAAIRELQERFKSVTIIAPDSTTSHLKWPCKYRGCGLSFDTRDGRTVHVNVHERQKSSDYICNICGQVSSTANNANKHKIIHIL